jgi:hypothetical protein
MRTPVNIDILTQTNGQAKAANLSASVFMIDALQKIPGQNIVSYLYLNSDLKGNIESPAYYFEKTDKHTDSALDNLLLTQGWRRFKWEAVLMGKKPAFEFVPELEGQVATGKMINKKTGLAAVGTDAFCQHAGEDHTFNITTSDDSGMIRYSFRNVYKNNVIVMQPALKKDSDNRIDILNAWSDQYSSARLTHCRFQKWSKRSY